MSEQNTTVAEPTFETLFDEAHLDVDPILKHFRYAHLPPLLRAVSLHFAHLAARIVHVIPRSAERSVALRKLLESKDAAVRAAL
jgi:hypothetical protein